MIRHLRLLVVMATYLLSSLAVAFAQDAAPAKSTVAERGDPLASWRKEVRVARISDRPEHSIHSYYVTTPESPDGKWVLFFASTTPTGHEGEIRVVERTSGKMLVIARDIATEDAHRAACQQWISGGDGKRIYFNVSEDDWTRLYVAEVGG